MLAAAAAVAAAALPEEVAQLAVAFQQTQTIQTLRSTLRNRGERRGARDWRHCEPPYGNRGRLLHDVPLRTLPLRSSQR